MQVLDVVMLLKAGWQNRELCQEPCVFYSSSAGHLDTLGCGCTGYQPPTRQPAPQTSLHPLGCTMLSATSQACQQQHLSWPGEAMMHV